MTGLFCLGALAQQGGQAPPGGGNTGGGTPGGNVPGGNVPGGTPGSVPRDRQPQFPSDRQQRFPEIQRPIFLSGKVQLDDGTPPPEPVVIEKVCNGRPLPQGYTDSKGRFSFQLGQNQAMLADASVSAGADMDTFGGGGSRMPGTGRGVGDIGGSGGMNERSLIGCELRASLPGFRSEVVNLTGRRVLDNPDVGIIVLRRLANVEGLTTTATTMMAPKDARKAWEKGREALKKNKLADADRELAKAVEIYPKFAVAWLDLGISHERQNRPEEARKAYEQSLAADSKFVNPYLQLTGMALKENKWQDVLDITDRVIKLNPVDFPQAFFYNAIANLQMQRYEAAEKSAREAVKLDENNRNPRAQYVLGVILANRNDFNGAAEYMNKYIELAPKAPDLENVRKQIAEIDRLRGGGTSAQAK